VAHSDAPGRSERSGEPEWSLRNGGCVAGLPCEDRYGGRGKTQNRASSVSSLEEDATIQKTMRLITEVDANEGRADGQIISNPWIGART
jgi:hypothetical protein